MSHEKRTLLAIVLCMVLFLFWSQYLFPPPATTPGKKGPADKAGKADKADKDKKPPAKNGEPPKGGGTAGGAPRDKVWEVTRKADKEDPQILLESDQVLARFSNRGAVLVELHLKQHLHKHFKKDGKDWKTLRSNLLPLFPGWPRQASPRFPTLMFWVHAPGLPKAFAPENELWVARAGSRSEVVFELAYAGGLSLVKKFTLKGRALGARIEVKAGKEAVKSAWLLLGPTGIYSEASSSEQVEVGLVAGDPRQSIRKESMSLSDLLDKAKDLPREVTLPALWELGKKAPVKLEWDLGQGESRQDLEAGASVASKYFAGLFRVESFPGKGVLWALPALTQPDPEATPTEVKDLHLDHSIRLGVSTQEEVTLEPGKSLEMAVHLEVGTREELSRRPYEYLDNLGFFGWVSRLLLWIMGLFHRLTANWGVAIILLTLLVRAVLYPLNKRQQLSMYKYQEKIKKFQPELEKLREKHKNNRQKLNEEMLKLYKKHGVQPIPLGGCLPILLQIPIFFGLFSALQQSILLRQATFLWITDLSEPDRLAMFSSTYWIIGRNFNLLPIVMTVVWVIQQRMMPKPSDPQMAQQQKILAWMPVIFGFMLYNFQSGLCLYWLVSNLVGILEQHYIKTHIEVLKATL